MYVRYRTQKRIRNIYVFINVGTFRKQFEVQITEYNNQSTLSPCIIISPCYRGLQQLIVIIKTNDH